jgi:hypothetical protein
MASVADRDDDRRRFLLLEIVAVAVKKFRPVGEQGND